MDRETFLTRPDESGESRLCGAPLAALAPSHGASALGVPLDGYLAEPTRLAEGQLRLRDRLGIDLLAAVPHLLQDVLAWGARIDYDAPNAPRIAQRAAPSFEALLSQELPVAAANGYLSCTLDAARELDRDRGDSLVAGALVGPVSLPSLLVGPEAFCGLLTGDPSRRAGLLPQLMDRVDRFCGLWAQEQFEAGCDVVFVVEPLVSSLLLDEESFLACARPALASFCSRVGMRGELLLAFEGPSLAFLPYLRDLRCGAFAIAEGDSPDSARRALGGSKRIVGALPNRLLIEEAPRSVTESAEELLFAAGPGFLLGAQGGEIPASVPEDNLSALIRASHTRPEKPVPA